MSSQVFFTGKEDLTIIALVSLFGEIERVLANVLRKLVPITFERLIAKLARHGRRLVTRSPEKASHEAHRLIHCAVCIHLLHVDAGVTRKALVSMPAMITIVDPKLLRQRLLRIAIAVRVAIYADGLRHTITTAQSTGEMLGKIVSGKVLSTSRASHLAPVVYHGYVPIERGLSLEHTIA